MDFLAPAETVVQAAVEGMKIVVTLQTDAAKGGFQFVGAEKGR